ncbi:hypothetical protein B0H17DRAFT_1223273 [Mycena rosella]|uniref:Uncharacterized protein n=1 Tax=Mycena rosella TaxID=1033263 RepID=A0AAD7AWC5_MYCRO|nr:hypothetical protein B0H17DRAFT_1223273 [Mycena rosella]
MLALVLEPALLSPPAGNKRRELNCLELPGVRCAAAPSCPVPHSGTFTPSHLSRRPTSGFNTSIFSNFLAASRQTPAVNRTASGFSGFSALPSSPARAGAAAWRHPTLPSCRDDVSPPPYVAHPDVHLMAF